MGPNPMHSRPDTSVRQITRIAGIFSPGTHNHRLELDVSGRPALSRSRHLRTIADANT